MPRLHVVRTLAAAALAVALIAAPAGAASPWTDPGYGPTPGDWQPYVLAPSSHQVQPVSILEADPRGGSIIGNPDAALSTSATVRLVSRGDRTQSPLLILDFGHEVAGQVQVHLTALSTPAPAIHACFSESRRYMALTPGQNAGETALAPGCDTANIWNGYPGFPYSWDSDSHLLRLYTDTLPQTLTDRTIRGGFRYLTLFLDGPGYADLNGVSLKFSAAPHQSDPAAYKGWFLSSDNELNKIWYAGAYTVQIDTTMATTAKKWPYYAGETDQANTPMAGADPTREVILDGGKRDRDVWQGDLAVEDPVTYLSTGDTEAIDNSLNALASQQKADGFMPAEGNDPGTSAPYGEYVTWFINNMAVHYLYTGDKAYLDKWYPTLTRTMAWLEAARRTDPQGLISFQVAEPPGGSCGHYAYNDCGHETYVNALYYRNLRQMAMLATAEGYPQAAIAYQRSAAELRHDINAQLWNSATGAYVLSRENTGIFPQDAQAAAITSGVANQPQATAALAYLRTHTWNAFGSLMVGGDNPVIPYSYEPLPMGFEVQARLGALDPGQAQVDSGLQLMRNYWGWQLKQDPGGTFWEKATASGTPTIGQFTSLAHGWAATPTIALSTQVLGVSPTAPGFSGWSVIPHPGSLKWAEGSVPTPAGPLNAHWRHDDGQFTLSVDAPKGSAGTVGVPTFGSPVAVRVDGTEVWDGGRGLADAASSDGTFVYVHGLGPGHHEVTSRSAADPAKLLYGFDDGTTQGWSAGLGVASVSSVGTFTDAPHAPFSGSRALDASCQAVPGTLWHAISLTPATALDLSQARTLIVHEDSSGGLGDTSGYQTRVTLISSAGASATTAPVRLSRTFATSPDAWNTLALDLSGWTNRAAISQIEIAFRANGSTTQWGCHFQIDDVSWN